jgi:cytochrome c oxidase assembly protein subunit 15
VIFLVGALQGAVGWFMVASGFFPESTSVAPYRLAIHLLLALALYTAVLWYALGLVRPIAVATAGAGMLRRTLQSLCVILVLTVVAGSFVAGTHAGFEYNTFPLMEGRLVPANYARAEPFLSNLFSNPAAVQFDHRLLATLTAVMAGISVAIGCSRQLPGFVRLVVVIMGALVALQYALGVAALLLVVPIPLAVAHQANAVLVLTAAIVALHGTRARGHAVRRAAPAAVEASP